jgi:hypothetical protein
MPVTIAKIDEAHPGRIVVCYGGRSPALPLLPAVATASDPRRYNRWEIAIASLSVVKGLRAVNHLRAR